MQALAQMRSRRVGIFSGVGGRGLLRAELIRRGAAVQAFAVYRRERVSPEDSIDPAQIDAISVSSGDGFGWAAQVWFAAGGNAQVPVYAPSARVAAMGAPVGSALCRR